MFVSSAFALRTETSQKAEQGRNRAVSFVAYYPEAHNGCPTVVQWLSSVLLFNFFQRVQRIRWPCFLKMNSRCFATCVCMPSAPVSHWLIGCLSIVSQVVQVTKVTELVLRCPKRASCIRCVMGHCQEDQRQAPRSDQASYSFCRHCTYLHTSE